MKSPRSAPRIAATKSPLNARRAFPPQVLSLLRASRMLGIRSGRDHKFTGIWFVLIGERVFVRPWFDKASGWRRAFSEESSGAILVSGREVRVRARKARGESLFDAVDAAYAEKYPTKASRKWVRGFALPRRRETTTELLPG